ncbi:filamentous hemagglutinin family protein [Variovorax sp. CY25R-8]|uniref:filamentous hemagglutinin family protein n=1 Tax=Variovorax sp. CY25R-8 TaxID=2855501 RepID=UPI0021BAEBD2|nr:filamentous hemagglutinin family protein [Variovorax sp. CY25R-8]
MPPLHPAPVKPAFPARPGRRTGPRRLAPLAHAVAVVIAVGAAGAAHAQQRAFSAAWMAQKNIAQGQAIATGRLPNGLPVSSLNTPTAQQQQAREQLQRSLGNLNLAAQSIAAQQAAQAAARQAALDDPSSVPDGLADGGLRVDTNSLTAGWLNAQAPVQSQGGDGRTTVTIQQTGDRAILNWESFNVGKRTTVDFRQQADWAVLNRVNDPQARPSQIQGRIKADGTVLIANRNGIVFSGSSQTDTRNLVAAAAKISDEQFKARGIYSAQQSGAYTPSFTDANGKVEVQAGARINTTVPTTVTQGGGYALLLGKEVSNAGAITTPRGQVQMAAGDFFIVRPGQSTTGNQYATTRGNEVAPQFNADSTAGAVTNTGLLQAPEGDITLAGRKVVQDGVAIATTTVDTRGTIHLLNSASDKLGSVTVTSRGLNAILLDDQSGRTALDSQRDALIADSAVQDLARRTAASGGFDNLARLDDRRDQSRIEIVSGGGVVFEGGSTTLATGGQIAVAASNGRSTVANGARLDVSGAVGVQVAMSSNNVQINIQGNEQRDAPLNRDTTLLNNSNVWIDRRKLLRVAAGVGGYDKERWYTPGGLLEVGGYLGLQGHTVGEWGAQGGSVLFAGKELVAQAGSNINLSGGTLDVQTGMIKQSWLKGSDGRLYEVSSAPADVQYTGLYKGYEDAHKRWGDKTTGFFYNPLIGPQQRLENGYTVGRDAGQLIVSTGAAVLEGDLTTTVYRGPRQTIQRDGGIDGYAQSHDAAALAAQLILGNYTTVFNPDKANGIQGVFHNFTPSFGQVVFGTGQPALGEGIAPDGPLPQALQDVLHLDSDRVNGWQLGQLMAGGTRGLAVEAALAVVPGGSIALYAPQLNVNADLTARGGDIALGNVLPSVTGLGTANSVALAPEAGQRAQTTVAAGATLDASGLWTNLLADERDSAGLPYVDGGSVSIRGTGDVTLAQGAAIDVSSGAALLRSGALRGGHGGDVTLAAGFVTDANSLATDPTALLTLAGELRAFGVNGGGTLDVRSGTAVGIGGKALDTDGLLAAGQAAPVNLRLLQDYQLAVGDIAPTDLSVTLTRRPAGYTVTGQQLEIRIPWDTPLVLKADWVVPFNLFDSNGVLHGTGSTVPAGTTVTQGFFLPVGVTIPAAVFPDGLPIASTLVRYNAGSVLDMPFTLAAGTSLAAGTVLARPVAVAATGTLSPALFQSGFSHYVVTASDGLAIAPGTRIEVNMPVLRADVDGLQSLATGSRLADSLPVWTPPLYEEDPQHATLVQRGGASIEFDAGSRLGGPGQLAPLTVGTGAHIAVDPGQAITLWNNGGQLTVDGRLDAWGGDISIASLPISQLAYRASTTRSVWIGDNAVLDAAARAYVARDAQGRAYGIAPDGGTIELGLSDSFIVIRPGAVLDASGAYAEVDASAGSASGTPARPLALAGAGGGIGLHSYVGMVIDGTLTARAGGAGAAGGSLTMEMANRRYLAGAENIPEDVQVMHNITLTQQYHPGGLADGLAPGQADAGLKYGAATLSADQVRAGGFDALTLSAHDLFLFDGDIDLALGRSLNLRNGFLTVADNTPDAKVRLAAPYIRFDGGTWDGASGYFSPGLIIGNRAIGSPARGDSALTLDASLIDIYGRVQSGIVAGYGDGAVVPNGPPVGHTVDAGGFAALTLRSEGDIRLGNAAFVVTGDLLIDAAQIYPVSGQRGVVIAGQARLPDSSSIWDQERSLTIRSNGHDAPVPDSVFGQLVLMGPTLDQGGVVRAPLGTIGLNDVGGSLNGVAWMGGVIANPEILPWMRLVLRDGSLTSVSAAGLTMPYGGTQDGLTYRGTDGTLFSLGGNFINRPNVNLSPDNFVLAQGISIGGGSVVAEPGSVLDLSGGGDLRGAGFITGRGGSVDVLTTALANANPAAYPKSGAGNAVYAIVPGYASAYAPVVRDKGAGDPAVGRQITIGAGVPGLPPGTYALLPASYALMPGAFRVEVGARMDALSGTAAPAGALADGFGSWSTTGTLGFSNTAVHDNLPSRVLVTPGQTVRHFSQYNETSYADFAKAQAALFGNVRPLLPVDGKVLRFSFAQNDEVVPLQFDGQVLLDAAPGGLRGQVNLLGDKPIDIVGGAARPKAGAIEVSADMLNAFRADTLAIGGIYIYFNGQDSSGDSARIYFGNGLGAGLVNVRDGATLRAGQIFLIGNQINVDGGAVLDTRGLGRPGVDSNLGFLYANAPGVSAASYSPAVFAVSNGWLDFLPALGTGTVTVSDGATVLSEGTIAFAAPGGLALGDVNLGARYLTVAQDQINIGTAASMAAAQAAGSMQAGWQLTQATLDRLLRPSASAGVPALERLSLTAGGAFNFYGSLTLDTGDSPVQLVFNTPAFYGLGTDSDTVRIATRDFVWNGIATGNGTTTPYAGATPAAVQPGGPGTGTGSLVIDARTVQFGYDALSQPQRQAELERLALGFGSVKIQATDRVTANNKAALLVGQSRDADGTLHGGTLSIVTPLLTGQAGSAMRYVAGGAIDVSAPAGAAAPDTAAIGELGASLTLQGPSVSLDTTVALPTGVLRLLADGDISLGEGAQIDLSGRAVQFYDITKYSWGGAATLASTNGSIAQAAGSRIDVSAAHEDAGSLTLDARAGTVTLAGALHGAGGGAGFDDGKFDLTTRAISDADFAALNARLNDAAFFGARGFVVKQGDLNVGEGVRARQVSIATDAGRLTVNGTIDASGATPGSIRLNASGDLTLAAGAVLDTHATTLVADSYGAPIDASNRAKISLGSTGGTVRLEPGATLDLRSPDGIARGHLDIDAPRVGSTGESATGADAPANATGGDIAIAAAGTLNIQGAQAIALNGVARYTNARPDPGDANGQIVDQAYLDLIDSDSRAFDAAARGNAELRARMAGLLAYGDAFHLRPGVEIASSTPTGNLTVKGDLDLSGYRYGPAADRDLASARYGAGEPMSLALRAGGDLNIHGSINDGFAPPPATPDDNGWQTRLQVLFTNQPAPKDVTVSVPFNATWGDFWYVFPGIFTGDFPVVVSGSISDDYGSYGPGDTIYNGFLAGTITVAAGTVLTTVAPGGADILLSGPRAEPGRLWAASRMLAAGSLSASIRLVSGADLGAADTRRLQGAAQLAGRGNLVLDDLHLAGTTTQFTVQAPSVVRTGTGDLELYAGGSYRQESLFGVYTAGTSVAGTGNDSGYNAPRARLPDGSVLGAGNADYERTLPAQRMWFTENGGDFTLSAQGDILGYVQPETLSTGEWLWRQGGAEIGERTAWGLNFGSYAIDGWPTLAQPRLGFGGFAGMGTLGGGNASVHAGGNIGTAGSFTRGLLVAVGSTGRVADGGVLAQTGGGNLDVSAGGQIRTGLYANLRGDTRMAATDVGSVVLKNFATPNNQDPRAVDPHTPYSGQRDGVVSFAPGDGVLRIETLGDLAIGAVVDAGRAGERVETQASNGSLGGPTASWFTLWTDRTALDLFSAGGNVSPFGATNMDPATNMQDVNSSTSIMPATLSAVAAGGSIYYATESLGGGQMMPSPVGHLDLLARDLVSGDSTNSISNGHNPIGPLGTALSSMATPLRPGWRMLRDNPFNPLAATNYWNASKLQPYEWDYMYQNTFAEYIPAHVGVGGALFNFGLSTVSDGSMAGEGVVSHIYAVNGDVLAIEIGNLLNVSPGVGEAAIPTYLASKPLRILAGGDIVNSSGLIVQNAPSDISMIAAGGDILYTSFSIAGPGTLEVSAGGQIYQGNRGTLTSLGAVVPGDRRPGADIAVQAGLGAGPRGQGASDFAGFAALYLDPANAIDASAALAGQPGKVVKTYDAELTQWLRERFGHVAASPADALAYFQALPPEQQRVFVREVFYDELIAGGREYNDVDSKRYGSYLRGREAIATLFPTRGADGRPIEREGGLTLYQGTSTSAGIRTVVGGDIQTLTPGGTTIVGVEGITPASTPGANPTGFITQGEGDIQMYSQGSILLGLSRIMTTFGGDILGWSATGDINAGRGSKTTLVYTPPKREYDMLGNVKLSPNVPSTGAGIATLDPIPEVPPGDVDLIAPLGTIDAGEAGIRVSGNVNLAALQVVNAANIQVKGESAGLPVVASVNVGALANASAAAAQATMAAQDVMQRERTAARQALPSVFTVRVLGFGDEPAAPAPAPSGGASGAPAAPSQRNVRYDPASPFQMLGQGALDAAQLAKLTPAERARLADLGGAGARGR